MNDSNIPQISKIFGLSAAPPHAIVEERSYYSIVFNLLGIGRKGVGIDVNPEKREVTVLARKSEKNRMGGFFWVFDVPVDAILSRITANYKGGALEIRIPKYSFALTG